MELAIKRRLLIYKVNAQFKIKSLCNTILYGLIPVALILQEV